VMFLSFFSPRVLRGPSTDRPETLPHGRNLAEFYNPTPKIRHVQNMKNFGQYFFTTLDFDREYLQNEATYPNPKSENVTNYRAIPPVHLVSEGPRRQLRSSTDRSCAVPRTRNTFGDRSFAVAGSRVSKSLPAHSHDKDMISLLTTVLGMTLKRIGFSVASGAQRGILLNCAI